MQTYRANKHSIEVVNLLVSQSTICYLDIEFYSFNFQKNKPLLVASLGFLSLPKFQEILNFQFLSGTAGRITRRVSEVDSPDYSNCDVQY